MKDETLEQLKPVIETRVKTLSEIREWIKPFSDNPPECNLEDLKYKTINTYSKIIKLLWIAISLIEYPRESEFKSNYLEKVFREKASLSQMKCGEFFFPVRVAITGSRVSLPLFETMEALGKKEVLLRLNKVLKRLEEIR